jgi:hypothetical protein
MKAVTRIGKKNKFIIYYKCQTNCVDNFIKKKHTTTLLERKTKRVQEMFVQKKMLRANFADKTTFVVYTNFPRPSLWSCE